MNDKKGTPFHSICRRVRPRLAFGDELANRRDQFLWNFHNRLSSIFECRFVLGHRLFFRLLFIVREHAANSLLIPASREIALLHLLPFRRRRRRYGINGLPRRSYAVITNTLSGSGSGT